MKGIEFYYTPEGDVVIKREGEAERVLSTETDADFIESLLQDIRDYYTIAYAALAEEYKKSAANTPLYHFRMVRRFIKCNFGTYDNIVDIDQWGRWKLEYVACPLRGDCPNEKKICSPLFNSKLTDREKELAKLFCIGLNDTEVAESLAISEFTVQNSRKKIFRKLKVHTSADMIRICNERNIV